jgi:hypothetical protein
LATTIQEKNKAEKRTLRTKELENKVSALKKKTRALEARLKQLELPPVSIAPALSKESKKESSDIRLGRTPTL